MKTTVNIGRYIGTRVTVLMVALVAIYSITVDRVYQWGIYDTTHYFLSLEADRLLGTLQRTGELPSVPSPDTQYFADQTTLPTTLQTLFMTTELKDGELLSDERAGMVTYLLPFKHPDTGQYLFVSHTYNAADDSYDVGINISELLLLIGLFILVIMVLLVKSLAWSIIQPVQALEKWASAITPDDTQRLPLSSSQLKFTELNRVADRLETSITTIENHNQREKSFLRTLSHELRTPLAIIKAALDLFEKKPEGLNASHQSKLGRMRRANNNMLSTTDCLLWLWSGQHKTQNHTRPKTKVHLARLVQDIVAMNRYLLQQKSVEVTVDIPQGLIIEIELTLLQMVVGNLVRNAFQYSAPGTITIAADPTSITVSNPIGDQPNDKQPTPSTPPASGDYGYGVGLYLVETICSQQDWPLNISREEPHFLVRVSYKGASKKVAKQYQENSRWP